MKPSIQLPESGDSEKELQISNNGSVVIIGKNGSGKSRLGIWIEQHCHGAQKVKRISAQRALQIPQNITMQNIQNGEMELIYGIIGQPENFNTKLRYLYQNKPHNFVLNDFQKVLSLLFAKKAKRDSNVVKSIRNGGNPDNSRIPESEADIIQKIWSKIYPHREILIEDTKIQCKVPESEIIYDGTDMSDGERVALYLMAQVLCVPENTVIILDEPEIHLNRTIIKTLWDELENARPDCLFVYITHNLEFAKTRENSRSYFIESFDGENWCYNEIAGLKNLPTEILMDLVGPRKNILFIEGNEGSLDFEIYSRYYDDYHVIPVQSCSNVIKYTQSINNNRHLHHFQAYGLIDRDFKSDKQLEKLAQQKIYSLKVAESENLMISEGVIYVVASYLKTPNVKDVVESIKSEILKKLEEEIDNEKQPTNFTGQHIKYMLEKFQIDHRNKETLVSHFDELIGNINIEEIFQNNHRRLKDIVNSSDYDEAIKYYNRKSLVSIVANKLQQHKEGYQQLIIQSIQEDCIDCQKDNILEAIEPYMPKLL